MALFSKRHYLALARFVYEYEVGDYERFRLANYLAAYLAKDNDRFNASAFIAKACCQVENLP